MMRLSRAGDSKSIELSCMDHWWQMNTVVRKVHEGYAWIDVFSVFEGLMG